LSFAPPARASEQTSLTVMVVEDNSTDRLFVSEILRSRGYRVVPCGSAEEALDAFEAERPDIVLLDLMLPGMGGTEMCRRLKSDPAGRDAFVIVVTGSTERAVFEEVLEAGADDFIRKPLDAAAFLVRLTIAERRIRSEMELQRAESELAARTRELETLFRNVQDVFFSVDLSNDRLIQISPAAESLFGVPMEELTGAPQLWRKFLAPVLEAVGPADNTDPDERTLVEHTFTRPSGNERWVRTSIHTEHDGVTGVRRVDGLTVDVTRELQSNQQLSERNSELAALYRLAELTLSVQGLEEGYARILELVSELTGFSVVAVEHVDTERDRLVVTASRGIPTSDSEALSIPSHQTLSGVAVKTGEAVLESDPENRREHAHPVLKSLGLSCYAAFPLFAAGRVFGTLMLGDQRPHNLDTGFRRLGSGLAATVATYVEQLEAQEAVRRSEQRHRTLAEQLQQANQELEAFAYSVSHDLRAPLRTMQGFSHALVQNFGSELPAEAQDYLRRIIASGQQSERLISDLLAYSRVSFERLKLEPIQLQAVVDAAREQVAAHLEESSAELTIETPLLAVLGNHTILVQVLANLISNAVKFVAEGTVPAVRIRAENAGARIRLWVEDNGIGIPENQTERIFGVFERLVGEEARPGTGIGLAIVRRGMQRIEGDCGVVRRPEGGSGFWIEAPAAKERSWRPRRRGRSL